MPEQKNTSVFRQKNLDRISSPEQLTDYLRVTNPGIWLVLAAVIVLLAGVFAWATVGTLETTAGATVIGVTAGNTDRLAEFSKDTEKCAGKFPVAADEGARIARQYDATLTLKPGWSSRTSYVIAQDGTVRFVHDDMNPNQHVKQTLDAVLAMKPAARK